MRDDLRSRNEKPAAYTDTPISKYYQFLATCPHRTHQSSDQCYRLVEHVGRNTQAHSCTCVLNRRRVSSRSAYNSRKHHRTISRYFCQMLSTSTLSLILHCHDSCKHKLGRVASSSQREAQPVHCNASKLRPHANLQCTPLVRWILSLPEIKLDETGIYRTHRSS